MEIKKNNYASKVGTIIDVSAIRRRYMKSYQIFHIFSANDSSIKYCSENFEEYGIFMLGPVFSIQSIFRIFSKNL